jgi:hypothetical protein
MDRRLLAVVGIAVVAALTATFASPAGAVAGKHAKYFPMSECNGMLQIDASPGTTFNVRCEQPDGSYAFLGGGQLGATGQAGVFVPHAGPTSNGQPQYLVFLRAPSGECCQVIATGPLEEEWWLD